MKYCAKCKIEKDLSNFTKDKSKKDGLKINCIDCCKLYINNYYKENIDKLKIKHNEYNKKRIVDKVAMKKYKHEHYKLNKEKIDIRNKEYRRKNKDILKEKRSENLILKLKENIGNNIRNSLRKNNCRKNSRTTEILNCTIQEFKLYLESKFEIWMSWENYGKYNGELNYGWDIDHIIPISSANTEEEIIKLNHYTNLQPLCSYRNRYIKRNL